MRNFRKTIPALLLAVVMLAGCTNPVEFYEEINDGSFSVKETLEDFRDSFTDKLEEKKSEKGVIGKAVDAVKSALGELGEEEDPYAEYEKIRQEKIVPFEEMEYSRPDTDNLREAIDKVKEALNEGKASLSEIEELLDVCMDENSNYSTMYSLANIRNCLDLTDEFYAEEYEWISENCADIDDLMDELYYACGGSKYASKLEKDYFWEGFAEEYADEEDSIYTPEFVALLKEEANLISEYRNIIADPTVIVNGREVNYNEAYEEAEQKLMDAYYAYLEDEENYMLYMEYYTRYFEWEDIFSSYYEQYSEKLGEIYIKLIKIRCEMAEEAGYDSAEEMQYDFYYERDYTPEQAKEFMDEVEEYIVPLYTKATERLSLDYTQDTEVTEQLIKDCLETVTEKMGGNFTEAYDFMLKYNLYDFSINPNKTPMSFQTYINDYEAPYLLISPSESVDDVLTAVHEFGHYTDAFGNYGANETIDLAECFSQGLEFLSLDMLEEELGEDSVMYTARGKIIDTISTYMQQCAFAEFESILYAMDEKELTVDAINQTAYDVSVQFGFADEEYESVYSYTYWMDISHFFESPFYVISYPVSCNVALQFYALEQEKEGKGIEAYNDMLGHESGALLETLEEYGMESPFDDGSVKDTADIIKQMCVKYR